MMAKLRTRNRRLFISEEYSSEYAEFNNYIMVNKLLEHN